MLTVAGANATIAAVDSALQTVSAFQSQLGAIQNRFTSTVSNLQSTSQNLTASRSTIQDADFAAETAKLTQSNVLQQAGISVLAQANQEPQLIPEASAVSCPSAIRAKEDEVHGARARRRPLCRSTRPQRTRGPPQQLKK